MLFCGPAKQARVFIGADLSYLFTSPVTTNRRMSHFILLPSGGLVKSSVVSVNGNSAGIFVDPGVRVDGILPISYHPAGMSV